MTLSDDAALLKRGRNMQPTLALVLATVLQIALFGSKGAGAQTIPPPPEDDVGQVQNMLTEEDFAEDAGELNLNLSLDDLDADQQENRPTTPGSGIFDQPTLTETPQRIEPDEDSGVGESIITLGQPGDPSKTFRIGIVPRGEAEEMLAAFEPMRKELATRLNRPVEILAMQSYSALIDAHVLKRIDLGFYSASAFVTADQLCRCVEPLVAPVATDGTAAVYAVILARSGSGIRDLDDLEGKTIAAGPADSIGGRLYQLASIQAGGIDPETYFTAIEDAGSITDAVLDLRDGFVDAAFAWSSMNGSSSIGYSRGTLSFLIASGRIQPGELDIIWKSRPLSHGPIAISRTASDEAKAEIEAYFVDLDTEEPALYDLVDLYYGGGYRAVEPSDYHGARVLAEQKIARRAPVKRDPVPIPRPDIGPAPELSTGSIGNNDSLIGSSEQTVGQGQ